MSQQINLFNPAFRRQKKAVSAAAMLQALALIAAGLLGAYALQVRQNQGLEQISAENDRQLTLLREQMLHLAKDLAARGSDKSAAEDLARAEERLQARRGLLNEVRTGAGGNAQGFSAYLAALARRTAPGVWLTAVELGKANELVLRGGVLQTEMVPAYIKSLNQEEPFAGRTVTELRLTAKDEPAPAPQPSQQQAARAPRSYVEFVMSMPL